MTGGESIFINNVNVLLQLPGCVLTAGQDLVPKQEDQVEETGAHHEHKVIDIFAF